ncbi:hypothetical protein A3H65_04155 [Candidatus Giovannonibacteria bacterium RIFCSPLOWO2_02_FULL_45_14]|uniref:Acylneuraminate cytidylyltransferase n=1 Tax=Candidatus Giovannonibacteria bacterium RIFCSPLOWO2_12_FULL_44_15 TaxID=1798364 RepID=A0A1F5XYN3_9BACT|nr:MAG: hypothetical protein A3C75_03805 [Candidatus Giovannonibacteria bacterium RIFCSPHIGHO2_02_FULL_44_31]OGF77047.1 MAG: hypothetical protein A3E62_02410 [Candidatus Giovannonibacteria bacterium RIFCSPHIGHO2_12_FULL_44_29]OGF91254.1 MAG: hypothetical protein A3H65_04155 [Candidatus Giovannonibacteria bacterium RIFCSPLOWO2_02_FULL_45_14]OGF92998.1 MAG: hypothetical protein A3G54_01985 [Candidatus Giovannonibacteria bacterium RIFCSPLOWO2_12_FULL_44_15]
MEILAIIQARGGSKSIPRKNIKDLNGKPLIAWTIEAAKNAKTVSRTIVSTDDEEIAAVARKFRAEAPFIRPAEFATDDAKSVGLLKHALDWLKENENYVPEIVVQLKPTNPLRTAEHIDEAIKSFQESPGIDSLITVMKAASHPLKTYKFNGDYLELFISEDISGIKEASKFPRQSLPEAFVQNSCVNVINPEIILKEGTSLGKKVKGLVMRAEDSINIDNAIDFDFAELLLKRRSKNEN